MESLIHVCLLNKDYYIVLITSCNTNAPQHVYFLNNKNLYQILYVNIYRYIEEYLQVYVHRLTN